MIRMRKMTLVIFKNLSNLACLITRLDYKET